MEFESPDVEREFPGLYASESASGKRSQEGDFSDDGHERSTKKDLLIGKRKEKKESKKDLGYAALEGESSPEEELDVKSPYKSKKTKSFKFPTIKEKREKSREKDVREKDKDKDKEKDRDKEVDREKEKKKESKSKLKLKDKKKVKTNDDATETVDEMPVFGVPLLVAIDRSRCHDGVEIPVVVRDCIDHIQDFGLEVESIYKISGVKSKVQHLRRSYNRRETVKLNDYDISTVTSLLKTFLRELPEPLLTTDLTPKFDSIVKAEAAIRDPELSNLLAQLPSCNLICLSWLIRHLECVAAHESHNKMGVSALGSIFGPVLQTSPRVVSALVTLCSTLFPNMRLVRYVPPLSAGCTSLPKSREAIAAELAKQDSLLNQIHSEMNHGCTMRSDQLWEVQRFITQLKRQLKCLEKAQEVSYQTADESQTKSDPASLVAPGTSTTKQAPISPSLDDKIDFKLQAPDEAGLKVGTSSDGEESSGKEKTAELSQKSALRDEVDALPTNTGEGNSESAASSIPVPRTSPMSVPAPAPAPEQAPAPAPVRVSPSNASSPAPAPVFGQTEHSSFADANEKGSESHLQLEYMELMKLQAYLTSRILHEREQVESLRAELSSITNSLPEATTHNISPSDVKTPVESLEAPVDEADTEADEKKKEREDLCKQNMQLMQDRMNLVRQIMLEHEKCINLRVQLGLHQIGDLK